MLLVIPLDVLLIISICHVLYGCYSLFLYTRKEVKGSLLLILVYANAIWAGISIFLFIYYLSDVSILGMIMLLSQPLVVGGLAYAEAKQLKKVK